LAIELTWLGIVRVRVRIRVILTLHLPLTKIERTCGWRRHSLPSYLPTWLGLLLALGLLLGLGLGLGLVVLAQHQALRRPGCEVEVVVREQAVLQHVVGEGPTLVRVRVASDSGLGYFGFGLGFGFWIGFGDIGSGVRVRAG